MTTEPDWASVLRVLYQAGAALDASVQPSGDGPARSATDESTDGEGDRHDELAARQYDRIAEDTGLSESEIAESIAWLDSNGLVERAAPPGDATGDERYAVELTPTGFEVAQEQVRHEREAEQGLERNRLQHSFNRAIALLTLGLVTINMFDSAIQITLQTDMVDVAYIVLLLGFGGMIVVLAGVVYSGLLSSYSEDDE
jgi:DNA-binding MarR family transcriptional regulator